MLLIDRVDEVVEDLIVRALTEGWVGTLYDIRMMLTYFDDKARESFEVNDLRVMLDGFVEEKEEILTYSSKLYGLVENADMIYKKIDELDTIVMNLGKGEM